MDFSSHKNYYLRFSSRNPPCWELGLQNSAFTCSLSLRIQVVAMVLLRKHVCLRVAVTSFLAIGYVIWSAAQAGRLSVRLFMNNVGLSVDDFLISNPSTAGIESIHCAFGVT